MALVDEVSPLLQFQPTPAHDFFVGVINTEPFTQALNVDGAAVESVGLAEWYLSAR